MNNIFFCLLSQGSVVVDFRVTFDEEVSDDQALSVLKNVVRDHGELGSFNVDIKSMKNIAPTAQPESEEPTKGTCLYPRALRENNTVVTRILEDRINFFPQELYPTGNSMRRIS